MRIPRTRRRDRSRLALAVAALAAVPVLAACGGGSSGSTVTLNYYNQPDASGAYQSGADACSKASGGKYKINYIKLPSAADQQRQQLVRRLAAQDSSVDIMGLDVTWEAEFAEAGWVSPWTGANKSSVEQDSLTGPMDTATWKGNLVAAPFNSNTQLLWYRSDLVPTVPKTWDEMISMAQQLAKEGKPHYIEIQGAQYEGLTVWFNTMVESAGGSILSADSSKPSMGQPAVTALQTMKKFATSVAADPSLSNQMEDQNRLQMEAGQAAFELNYPFVYPAMKADKPDLFKVFKYATFPTVDASQPSKPTLGGIDLAISKYSKHQDLAFQAAICLRNEKNQLTNAITGGLPPTLKSLYTNPTSDFKKNYPFYQEVYYALQNGSIRPKTPAYQNVSIVISHALSPPGSINPSSAEKDITSQLSDALASKGLIP